MFLLLAKIERGWWDWVGGGGHLEETSNSGADQPNQVQATGYLPFCLSTIFSPVKDRTQKIPILSFLFLIPPRKSLRPFKTLQPHIISKGGEKKSQVPHLLGLKIFEIHIFSSSKKSLVLKNIVYNKSYVSVLKL